MSKIIDKLKGLEEHSELSEKNLEYAEIIEEEIKEPKKNFLKISLIFIVFIAAAFVGFKVFHLFFSKTNVLKSEKKEVNIQKNVPLEPITQPLTKKENVEPVVFSGGKNFKEYLINKLEKEPNNPIVLNNLAIFYYEQNNLEDALKYAQRALKFDPENSYLWNTLGIILTELKLYEDAEKCFKKAYEKKSEEGVFYYNLANLYERMDKNILAREYYLLYLTKSDKINPKNIDSVREKLKKGV